MPCSPSCCSMYLSKMSLSGWSIELSDRALANLCQALGSFPSTAERKEESLSFSHSRMRFFDVSLSSCFQGSEFLNLVGRNMRWEAGSNSIKMGKRVKEGASRKQNLRGPVWLQGALRKPPGLSLSTVFLATLCVMLSHSALVIQMAFWTSACIGQLF